MTIVFYPTSNLYFDIGNWDVSNVTSFSRIFEGVNQFNQDISNWDVSSVTNMGYMFSGWDQLFTDENYMFFNQNLSSWNVNNVSQCQSFCSGYSDWTEPKPNFTNCSEDTVCN